MVSEESVKRRGMWGMIGVGIAIVGIATSLVWLGVERYRSHRFYNACVTGDESVLSERGYRSCGTPTGEDDQWFCDPRQLELANIRPEAAAKDFTQVDRCEFKRVGRRLRISFIPAAD